MSRPSSFPPAPPVPSAAVRAGWAIRLPLLLASALTGGLIGASFLDFRLYGLAWVAFSPLLWAIGAAPSLRETIIASAVAGGITNILGFYWLVYTINAFGGFPYPVALFFFACLTAYSTLQFVLFAVAVRRTGWGPLGLAPAVLWTALEFLYPSLFPWRMAHTQLHWVSLMQIGDATGPYALSLLVVWASAAVVLLLSAAQSVRWRRFGALIGVAIAIAALHGYGVARISHIEGAMQAVPAVEVALVQGNVGIKEKGNAQYFEVNISRYQELTSAVQSRVALAIWPETVSQVWVPTGTTVLDENEHPFRGLQTYLIYGGLAFRQTGRRTAEEFNSAFLIDPTGRVLGRYDKRILMPFGEYIPFAGRIPWVRELSPYTGGFTAGREPGIFDVPGLGRVGPLICFEDLPASIPRATTRAGAELLVAIANDAWYGESAAPYEHQALALWRAIENRRYLLRVNNTGVTGVIDPVGRVVGTLPIFSDDVLVVPVRPLRLSSLYTRIGDVFAWIIVMASGVLLIRGQRGPNSAFRTYEG